MNITNLCVLNIFEYKHYNTQKKKQRKKTVFNLGINDKLLVLKTLRNIKYRINCILLRMSKVLGCN